ncbi:MAG: M1 family metallopeptidase [Chitinophagales bacterium]|nr:M1 family metallopeptidase [Chitinophagales bacterium]MDW8420051.1 M1 family metallopeptidase [Chitinophagales bacterium]
MKYSFLLLLLSALTVARAQSLLEQKKTYTRADTLRGTLLPERACYDVTYYELDITLDTAGRSLSGSVKFYFNVLRDFKTLQFDLFENMQISAVEHNGKSLPYRREYNAVFVDMPMVFEEGTTGEFTVRYYGKPTIAKRPPWDGGFVWTYDRNGKLWVAVACEGIGASLWWPNKDYLGDEPDSMRIRCNVPNGLRCIANGTDEGSVELPNGTTTYRWKVSYPINNYNVTLNIGDYVQIHDIYVSTDGDTLDLDYYVLSYNREKALKHFEQVKPMLACYEKYLGKYPFWNDGYALVETPYLGMEHQGAIAYGNRYLTGYAGFDHSRIGLNFDYIIIHETGHEWWGNSVSCYDIADMWIHESFCTYTEAIYVECLHGYDTALRYINAVKPTVGNQKPIVGVYGVNEEGDGDMYAKGMLFLNTLRHIFNDDEKWWSTIKFMADKAFRLSNIGYDDVVNYFCRAGNANFRPIFEQYLKHPNIPTLEYKLKKNGKNNYQITYRWQADVSDFRMPAIISTGKNTTTRLEADTQWQSANIPLKKESELRIRTDLTYIHVKKIK